LFVVGKNSSAMLFVGAKVSQYGLLTARSKIEATDRVSQNMVAQMGFGKVFGKLTIPVAL